MRLFTAVPFDLGTGRGFRFGADTVFLRPAGRTSFPSAARALRPRVAVDAFLEANDGAKAAWAALTSVQLILGMINLRRNATSAPVVVHSAIQVPNHETAVTLTQFHYDVAPAPRGLRTPYDAAEDSALQGAYVALDRDTMEHVAVAIRRLRISDLADPGRAQFLARWEAMEALNKPLTAKHNLPTTRKVKCQNPVCEEMLAIPITDSPRFVIETLLGLPRRIYTNLARTRNILAHGSTKNIDVADSTLALLRRAAVVAIGDVLGFDLVGATAGSQPTRPALPCTLKIECRVQTADLSDLSLVNNPPSLDLIDFYWNKHGLPRALVRPRGLRRGATLGPLSVSVIERAPWMGFL